MRFHENKDKYKEIIIDWWSDLKSQTGDRAALRKCSNGLDTLLIPYTHRLISKLAREEFRFFPDKIGPIAGLLSHVEEDNPSVPFARSMARKEGERSIINEIRFRKILQYSDILSEELFYQNMIRIVKNLRKKANLLDLSLSVYSWNQKTKKNWAYDYYGTPTSENNLDISENPQGENQ
ncbi:type I-E CRISPR-associated protein Cse2/CasB [Leptospira santarosai]|uniref:type I-E CRISPR-associated protein Cse2/CasB n=1 Tax=Leptospira santarosai TaxID=28183 RepID=UPI0007783029|nr:type I-E CRISPR-associated protein Cse2/CasB [Leptospira santarosai]KXZ32572.1 type I-E CRISPR-associated protein Cse2/CasB [Leptospira santarosai]